MEGLWLAAALPGTTTVLAGEEEITGRPAIASWCEADGGLLHCDLRLVSPDDVPTTSPLFLRELHQAVLALAEVWALGDLLEEKGVITADERVELDARTQKHQMKLALDNDKVDILDPEGPTI